MCSVSSGKRDIYRSAHGVIGQSSRFDAPVNGSTQNTRRSMVKRDGIAELVLSCGRYRRNIGKRLKHGCHGFGL